MTVPRLYVCWVFLVLIGSPIFVSSLNCKRVNEVSFELSKKMWHFQFFANELEWAVEAGETPPNDHNEARRWFASAHLRQVHPVPQELEEARKEADKFFDRGLYFGNFKDKKGTNHAYLVIQYIQTENGPNHDWYLVRSDKLSGYFNKRQASEFFEPNLLSTIERSGTKRGSR